MGRSWSQGQRFLTTAIVIAVLVFSVLGFALYRVISNAARTNVANQTAAASSSAAQTIAGTIVNQVQLANAVVSEDGIGAYVQGEADRLTTSRVEYANTNIQKANPQVSGFYFYDSSGNFVFAQTVDPTHQSRNQSGASCDTTNVYCVLASAPATGYFNTQEFQKYLAQTARPNAAPLEILVFDANDSAYGSLYIFKSIPGPDNKSALGTMVEQIDAGRIFTPYLHAGNSGNLILAGPVVISPDIAAYHAKGQLPVLSTAGLDTARVNGLKPVRVDYDPTGATPAFLYKGTAVEGTSAPVTMSDLQVVNYAPSSALPTSSALAIFGSVVFFLVLIATIVALSFYLNRRVQRGEQESAMLIRAKSEALTEDIVAVSQALAVAREGDLTVQVPDSESEVGLLSLSLNGLISDYGQIVGGIIRASPGGAGRRGPRGRGRAAHRGRGDQPGRIGGHGGHQRGGRGHLRRGGAAGHRHGHRPGRQRPGRRAFRPGIGGPDRRGRGRDQGSRHRHHPRVQAAAGGLHPPDRPGGQREEQRREPGHAGRQRHPGSPPPGDGVRLGLRHQHRPPGPPGAGHPGRRGRRGALGGHLHRRGEPAHRAYLGAGAARCRGSAHGPHRPSTRSPRPTAAWCSSSTTWPIRRASRRNRRSRRPTRSARSPRSSSSSPNC